MLLGSVCDDAGACDGWWGLLGNYVAHFYMVMLLYPCCGRIAAALRGPNVIKLLCSFGADAGI